MRGILVCLAVLGLATVADAGLITLDLPAQTGTPGDTLVFTGTLFNSGTDTLFLNSAQLGFTGSSFTVNFNDPFNNNVPASLAPGESTSSIELFDIMVNSPFTDPPGTYTGFYALLGGSDPGSQQLVGLAEFSVTVNASTTTPEPGLFALVAGGLGVLLSLRRPMARK